MFKSFPSVSVSVQGAIAQYANLAAFPVTAANGAMAVALDTGTLYIYRTSDNAWHEISAAAADINVGAPILSGTAGRVLFENGSNDLAQDAALAFDPSGTKQLTAGATLKLINNEAATITYDSDNGFTNFTTADNNPGLAAPVGYLFSAQGTPEGHVQMAVDSHLWDFAFLRASAQLILRDAENSIDYLRLAGGAVYVPFGTWAGDVANSGTDADNSPSVNLVGNTGDGSRIQFWKNDGMGGLAGMSYIWSDTDNSMVIGFGAYNSGADRVRIDPNGKATFGDNGIGGLVAGGLMYSKSQPSTHHPFTNLVTVDMAPGNVAQVALDEAVGPITGPITINITNAPSGSEITIVLQQTTFAAVVSTWTLDGGTVMWPGGVTPTNTTTNGALDVMKFTIRDGIAYGTSALAYA